MSSRQFEPSRAVEVIAPRYGSGYRIGGRLVLSAAHLLDDVGSECKVRDKQSFGKEKAQVVWKAQDLDIALIELSEKITKVKAVTLGKLPEAIAGEKLVFQMYAYPLWARTQREQGSAAGGRQIEGIIYLSDRSPDGLLVLEAERLPPEVTAAQSEWEGASGAAIVCDGLVVAVQSQHQKPTRPASLEASPLWVIYADEQWRQLIEKHGINPEPEISHLPIAKKTLRMTRQKFIKLVFLGGFGAAATAIISQRLENEQEDWHFCSKCHVLFYDGYERKGYCAAGGKHEAAGYNFVLWHNVSETTTAQTDWRFCNKCQAMFYQGAQGSEYDQRRGVCAAGGEHEPAGYNFVLPHDVPGTLTAQTDWRFCNKCQAMFYQGAQGSEYDQRRGVCAAGGEHEPAGYNFVLPWREPQILRQSFISTQFEASQCITTIIVSGFACSCSTLA